MGKHHDELAIQLELLMGVQRELKESFEVVESTWRNKKELSYLTEIDRWEQMIIDRIRQIAEKARTTVNEMMTKNMSDIRRRLNQLAFDMEQRQQEGNYLDNDLAEVRKQLEQINNNIKHVNEKIRIDSTATNKVDWDSLIYVTTEKKLATNRFSLSEFHYEQEDTQDKIWNNLRKLLRNKHTTNDYKSKQSSFKRNTTSLFEPIVLTSFDSSTCSFSEQNSCSNRKSTIFESSFQRTSFSNDESFNRKSYISINHDQVVLPQASDA
jgi:hypothetical protein